MIKCMPVNPKAAKAVFSKVMDDCNSFLLITLEDTEEENMAELALRFRGEQFEEEPGTPAWDCIHTILKQLVEKIEENNLV